MPVDKHRNPDGTYDGLAVLGEMAGLSRSAAQDMLAQVKANSERLNGCTRHDFAPIPPLRTLGQRYRCEHCGGEIDAHAYHWHQIGRESALGRAEP